MRSAYEFEYALKRVLSDNGFETVSKLHNQKEQKNDFGVRVTDREDVVYFEVKTSQSPNGWTGATHSEGSGKIDNYVLVNYELDRDMLLPPLNVSSIDGLFKSVHFSVIDGFELGWHGEATDKSSFTKARIHNSQYGNYSKQVVFGSISPKKTWCRIIRENLKDLRDNNGKLITGGKNVSIAA